MAVQFQFRCVDAAVIRVAAYENELELPPWPDLTDETSERVRHWRSWLRQVCEQEALIEAIEVASPALVLRAGKCAMGTSSNRVGCGM